MFDGNTFVFIQPSYESMPSKVGDGTKMNCLIKRQRVVRFGRGTYAGTELCQGPRRLTESLTLNLCFVAVKWGYFLSLVGWIVGFVDFLTQCLGTH